VQKILHFRKIGYNTCAPETVHDCPSISNDLTCGFLMLKINMEKLIRNIKKWIDSWNVNFLLGSGLSSDFLWTLATIEIDLTKAEKLDSKNSYDATKAKIVELKKEYFDKCMIWNIKIINEEVNENKDKTLDYYKEFFKVINNILLKRENTLLTKQVNIFTTNIDIFLEKALEETWLEYNDWFHWKINPIFDVWNFKKSIYKKSLHYENTSEIPIFNILKIHGSLSWKQNTDERKIYFDRDLELVKEINTFPFDIEKYNELTIVNPKKSKFEDTVLNQYYYDLLRLYSNELEKENSLLFVMWFSFADEHIKGLTLRVADSNPTLKIYIFKYSPKKEVADQSDNDKLLIQLEKDAKNKNIEIVYPEWEQKYDLKTITEEIFEKIVPYDEVKEIVSNNQNEND